MIDDERVPAAERSVVLSIQLASKLSARVGETKGKNEVSFDAEIGRRIVVANIHSTGCI